MENRQKTPSVIAKLMDFDETPTRQHPVSGQLKVFSKNYLQKSGSVGKRSRRDSQNYLLGSKRRANLRTNNSNKDFLLRDFEQKSLRFDGMQGIKSTVVLNSGNNGGNGKSLTKIVVLRPIGNVQHASGPSFLLDSQTVFTWEVKKRLLERLKMAKVSQELQSDFRSLIGIRSKEGWKHESVTNLPNFKSLNYSYNSIAKSLKTSSNDLKPTSVKLVNDTTVNTQKNNLVSNQLTPFSISSNSDAGTKNFESFPGDTKDQFTYSTPERYSSHLLDFSSEQDSQIRSLEDGSVSSNCMHIDEEHSDSKVETYQHSPNSVLETPFREGNSSSSECSGCAKTDLGGLWMQLQLLKSESGENDMNPEMVTSSDDERSTFADQILTSMISCGAKESRDFSYLVDVLDESGFQDGNVEIRFERWQSSESMTSSSVFEKLEKKYGKQELWHVSERRLLFDRINSGMTEILRPRADIRVCSKRLRRKMGNMFRRDVIEEELLALFLDQEKEVDEGATEKAVGRGLWFDPVDELDSLVREIEIFLFDELVAELISA